MQIGWIGLGKMGGNMVQRLMQDGHSVVGYDTSAQVVQSLKERGMGGADSIDALLSAIETPRTIWVMVPAGEATDATIGLLATKLRAGDLLIDGGNSNFHDSKRHAALLAEHGIGFLDAGTSGGIWGLKNGYCLMVGGTAESFRHAEPILRSLAPEKGYLHVGPAGAGHFVKMVHNGIEYGMLQAYAEGFEILHASEYKPALGPIADLWNQGSVVRSWLLELAAMAFAEDPELSSIRGWVEDSGEGRWTVQEAIATSVPAPVITLALMERFRSRQDESFGAKVIAALRNAFGGHAVRSE